MNPNIEGFIARVNAMKPNPKHRNMYSETHLTLSRKDLESVADEIKQLAWALDWFMENHPAYYARMRAEWRKNNEPDRNVR